MGNVSSKRTPLESGERQPSWDDVFARWWRGGFRWLGEADSQATLSGDEDSPKSAPPPRARRRRRRRVEEVPKICDACGRPGNRRYSRRGIEGGWVFAYRCDDCRGVQVERALRNGATVHPTLPFEDDSAAQRFVDAHPTGALLEDVGRALGLSKERVRQLVDEALAKLHRRLLEEQLGELVARLHPAVLAGELDADQALDRLEQLVDEEGSWP